MVYVLPVPALASMRLKPLSGFWARLKVSNLEDIEFIRGIKKISIGLIDPGLIFIRQDRELPQAPKMIIFFVGYLNKAHVESFAGLLL